MDSVQALAANVGRLARAVEALTERIESLELTAEKPILREMRDLPEDEAKPAVQAYFESRIGEQVYPSDIAIDLSLPYNLVIKLIAELEANGEIKKA